MGNKKGRADRAMPYARASKYYYSQNNMRLAVKYWNLIYKLPISIPELCNTMRLFSDTEVYDITDYNKDKYYKAIGYYI